MVNSMDHAYSPLGNGRGGGDAVASGGGGARRYIGGSECNEEEEPILKSAGSMVYDKIM